MKLCLDTNAYCRFLAGNETLRNLLENAEEVIVPAAVVAEFYDGFANGSKFQRNVMLFESFLARPCVRVQPADKQIAIRWGLIAASLLRKGRPIPVNDLWIAATAFETASVLLSYDRHFDAIEGLLRLAP
ncbi:MAG: type II toxin-antitoxin system VapC family toxin [Kiritimatiellae bacterium]|nr:type II toxin-antitoxin system VapC family toxin [Kiritimatiellia bacterium]